MQRAFVTGGSGFLGGALLAELRRRGIAARGLARSKAAAAKVRDLGAEVVDGDLDVPAALLSGMTGCDAVFHCAAYAKEVGPLREFVRANVDGTRHVLEAAQAAGVARLVHVSTEAVLADGRPIVRADERRPLPSRPVGPYPLTKGRAETLVLEAARRGFVAMIVRPRFIWGPGDTTVLPAFIEAVRAGRFAWIGGGRYPSSTCHVDNVVAGMLLAAERGVSGGIYFLTDGPPVELRDFLTRLLATQGIEAGNRSVPRWVASALAWSTAWLPRPPVSRTALALMGHEVTVDDGRARRELGYVPQIDVDRGLADMRTEGRASP